VGVDRSIITRVNGTEPTSAVAAMLTEAGFLPTPRGFRVPRA